MKIYFLFFTLVFSLAAFANPYPLPLVNQDIELDCRGVYLLQLNGDLQGPPSIVLFQRYNSKFISATYVYDDSIDSTIKELHYKFISTFEKEDTYINSFPEYLILKSPRINMQNEITKLGSLEIIGSPAQDDRKRSSKEVKCLDFDH